MIGPRNVEGNTWDLRVMYLLEVDLAPACTHAALVMQLLDVGQAAACTRGERRKRRMGRHVSTYLVGA